VHHPTHIGLVDAHPERDRGDDDPGRAVEERRHRPAPGRRAQPGVIQRHPFAGRGQRVTRRFRVGVGRGVDDPRARELGGSARDQRLLVVG
jgi:hypothetical protein